MENLFLSHLLKQDKKLPTLPAIAAQLIEAVQKDEPDIGVISAIIANDPPLSIEVLKFVNSPYFGFRRKISSVHHAAQMLGINTVKNLAISFALIKTFSRQSNGFDYSDFWKDSLVAAVSCKLIAQAVQPEFAEDAFFLGLLHNIGILVLVEYLPSEYEPVIQEVKEEKTHLSAVENQILGFDHMQIGSYLVKKWGLPDIMVHAIRFHHHPDQQDGDSEPLETATHILHLSTLFTEFFQKPEEALGIGVIRHFIDRYGFSPALDVGALLESTNAQVSEVLPAFDISGYDRECYQTIIERVREELLNVSFDHVQKLVEQRQQIEALKQNVTRDGLTSLYNHNGSTRCCSMRSGDPSDTGTLCPFFLRTSMTPKSSMTATGIWWGTRF
ncbi:MAG: HDOD domain-containing protein [Desulfobacterales bacterium]|jgi:HD-like signal output (HDOD) protein